MKPSWFNSVFPIAAIFSFRMLGLFMLIPVFTVYAAQLYGATPALMGLALGAYGLSQGLLQMPMGLLSDRFGRKPVLTFGLILFACGSLLGALSHSIYTLLVARILQGAGAIGSVLIALLADLTLDEQRTKAMAVIGITIGLSFSLAMVISPALASHFGLAGIFYFTTALALLGLLLLHLVVANPVAELFHVDSQTKLSLLATVIANTHLQRLDAGIFFQHFILTATFYVLPMLLQQHIDQGELTQQWHFYLPLMIFAFIMMLPFIIVAEKKHQMKKVFICAVFVTGLVQWLLAIFSQHWLSLCLLIFVYFVAFNILEACLPSLVSKQAQAESKGTAMGIYSSCQFLGIFAGGSVSGLLYQFFGNTSIFVINGCLALLWLTIAYFMNPNDYVATLILPYTPTNIPKDALITTLKKVAGIKDVLLAEEEKVIYLRVDQTRYSQGSAEIILQRYR